MLKEIYSKSASWMKKQLQQQPDVTWFDIKVFYIKIDACGFDPAPASLTIHYAPRSSSTDLEINGKRIRPSASAFLTLRREGNDENKSVATYVSTDLTRTTGKVCFDICVREETLICGTLDRKGSVKDDDVPHLRQESWTVDCCCALDYPSKWSSTKPNFHKFPSLELYIAGRAGSSAMVLTGTEKLIPRRKRVRQGVTLDVIPEGNDYENSIFDSADHDRLENEEILVEMDDISIAMICDAATERLIALFEPWEVQCFKCSQLSWLNCSQLSWLNAGLRLGVGFGLGTCLGLGIGVVILFIRTYEARIRHLRRLNQD